MPGRKILETIWFYRGFRLGAAILLNSIGIPPFLPPPMLDLRNSEPARRNRDISDKLPAIVTMAKNL
jgi:hypothetical protein